MYHNIDASCAYYAKQYFVTVMCERIVEGCVMEARKYIYKFRRHIYADVVGNSRRTGFY